MSLLFQIPVVILVTLACGWLAHKLGQARVVGEIIGGILLGPSVFGRLAPAVTNALFPQSSMASFEILSTIGLILFLFLIGTEVNLEHLYQQRATAALSSTMSILVPFALGALLAPSLRIRFASPRSGDTAFVLFLGIAMSITAFPVLARILEERGIQRNELGATAILCAAVDDVVAWLLLAVALALIGTGSDSFSLAARLVALAFYLLVMIGVVRPIAARLVRLRKSPDLSIELFGIMIVFAFASAATTDALGLHPLFGAFLGGICFPRANSWQEMIRKRLDIPISALLLPLFFAITGMRTRLDLLDKPILWFWTAVILVAATFGKIGGATVAARWSGQPWRHSLALGALLNTRGLVELIVLNIGYKAGIFSPPLFTMMVVMALVTTMCTTPMLNLLRVQNNSSRKQATGGKGSQPPVSHS